MPEILVQKTRKARKKHTCSYCGGIIQNGVEYLFSKLKDEDQFYEWKSHMDCDRIANELYEYIGVCDGLSSEEFVEGCRAFCEEYICPDCEFDRGECNETHCLDKIEKKLKTHRLRRCKRRWYVFELVERNDNNENVGTY